MAKCKVCDKSFSIFELTRTGMCDECLSTQEEREAAQNSLREAKAVEDVRRAENIQKILLTTANSIPGFEHYEVISIVGAEAAIGINIFKDITTAVRDIIGGRSKAVQDAMKQARSLCMQELKQEAFDVGADAVIGIDFDYSELSGGSGGLFLAVTGTAIKLSK